MRGRPLLVRLLLPLILVGGALTAGCEQLPDLRTSDPAADTTRAPGVPPPGEGLVTTATDLSVQATTRRLKNAIERSKASLIAAVDHAQHASGVGTGLRPMRLLIFGRPALETPLMQEVPTAGLDLPQKMLVWQGADDSTRVTYNAPAYLKTRHDLSGVDAFLNRESGTLTGLVEAATGQRPDTVAFNADSIEAAAGLMVEMSDFGFEETFTRLHGAVQDHPRLSVTARVDHAQHAAATGDSLRPTRLLVFGAPEVGTPLMRRAPTLGIDLPQKMLVYESEERNTFLVYNEPAYLARRHELADTTGLPRIAQTLEKLAFQATSNQKERQAVQEAMHDSSGVSF